MRRSKSELGSGRAIADIHLQNRSKVHEARRNLIEADGRVSKYFANRALNKAVAAFNESGEHIGMVQAVAEYPSNTPPVQDPQPEVAPEQVPDWQKDTDPMGVPLNSILSEITRPQYPTV